MITKYRQTRRSALANILRKYRIAADITQTELADKLGVPQSFVSKYESGERRLDLIELSVIADVLDVKLSKIVRDFEAA
ncbi:MAG: helix-turn-helix domain-containing protein [Gammaproteobacteria bacterium]|nr:helix-turn-helix domain-containing protein [Gammaproteobacteria bacterium]